MLLAKIALGFFGTAAVAGAYTFHEGIMRVDEDHIDGRHVHVWVPAAIVPMAMHVVPSRHLKRAVAQAGPWLPTVRALSKELKKYRGSSKRKVLRFRSGPSSPIPSQPLCPE